MYDPEEACNENDNSEDVKTEPQEQDDEQWAEVDEALKAEKSNEQTVEIKTEKTNEEEVAKTGGGGGAVNSPRTRRAAGPKNGAGAGGKAKRGRK